MYNIFIVGAGYVGRAIAEKFVEKKQRVFGLVKTDASRAKLEELGVTPVQVDLNCADTLKTLPPAHFIVICPAPYERSDEAYEQIYVKGVGNYLKAIRVNPRPLLIIYISSTRVWGKSSSEWIDESVPTTATSRQAEILCGAERQVLDSGYPSLILRLCGIYGGERNRLNAFRQGSFRRRGPDKYLNFIHRDDVVNAVSVLFKSGVAGEVYTGVDDQPVLESEFYRWFADQEGIQFPPDLFTDGSIEGKRLLNNKLKSVGFQCLYPSFKEGYSQLRAQSEC